MTQCLSPLLSTPIRRTWPIQLCFSYLVRALFADLLPVRMHGEVCSCKRDPLQIVRIQCKTPCVWVWPGSSWSLMHPCTRAVNCHGDGCHCRFTQCARLWLRTGWVFRCHVFVAADCSEKAFLRNLRHDTLLRFEGLLQALLTLFLFDQTDSHKTFAKTNNCSGASSLSLINCQFLWNIEQCQSRSTWENVCFSTFTAPATWPWPWW